MDTVYLIDSMNYIFRAYYAVPHSVSAPSGMQTNAVLGYLRTLLRIIKEQKPNYIAAAFEGAGSFRSRMYADYKATRAETPAALYPQFAYCKEMTEAIGISCFEIAEYEADDVIGTIARRMADHGMSVTIVTGDKDLSQLVSRRIRVYDIARELWLDEEGVKAKFGVAPDQIPDLLALLGDHVDNIPGVPGIGEKTARQILSACRNLEEIETQMHRLHDLPMRGRGSILKSIRENMERARMSRTLATIHCEIPIDVTPQALRYRFGDTLRLDKLCRELGFKKVQEEIPVRNTTGLLFP